jgi:hypothetical protein
MLLYCFFFKNSAYRTMPMEYNIIFVINKSTVAMWVTACQTTVYMQYQYIANQCLGQWQWEVERNWSGSKKNILPLLPVYHLLIIYTSLFNPSYHWIASFIVVKFLLQANIYWLFPQYFFRWLWEGVITYRFEIMCCGPYMQFLSTTSFLHVIHFLPVSTLDVIKLFNMVGS